jgi:cellobiose phosphorylase
MTIEVCGDANEFDAAPFVDWDAGKEQLTMAPADGSLLQQKFPDSCLLAKVNAGGGGGSELLGGSREPVVVIDSAGDALSVSITGHYGGVEEAGERFETASVPDWNSLMSGFRLKPACDSTSRLSDTLNWYAHNAMIHFAAPRGIEQYGGAAWGTRDVCQGPVEFLLALGHDRVVSDLLCEVFSHQFGDSGTWPQWFMFDGFGEIRQHESHGDIVYWPLKALCDYIEATGDRRILDIELPYDGSGIVEPMRVHVEKAVQYIMEHCVEDSALPSYGDGDWNDSLQPADQAMKTHMASGWTTGLAYQTLSALAVVLKDTELNSYLEKLSADFRKYILKNGVAAGFVRFDGRNVSHMLHPSDFETGIRYRLLPINRSILSGLFTPEEKDFHLGLVDRYLKFPDGVRLMDRPPEYTGGQSVHFQRAETAAHFGREIGLQYVHAHIRYCEALAKVGRADELLEGLLAVSPVAIQESVPNALPRQANMYFSSSDAAVNDRYETISRMEELKKGEIGALGGWRLYSSGPGIYIGLVIGRLFGIRRSYGKIEIDPVLPKSLDGAELSIDLFGKKVKWIYRVRERGFTPSTVSVNGIDISSRLEPCENLYRSGGVAVDAEEFSGLLTEKENTVEVVL